MFDILNINQNAGAVSQDMVDFYEEKLRSLPIYSANNYKHACTYT